MHSYTKLRIKYNGVKRENEKLKEKIRELSASKINIDVPHYKAKIQYLTEQLAKAQSKLQGFK